MDSPGPENVYNCRVGKTAFFCYTKAERNLPFPGPAGMDTEFLISFYTIQRGMSMKKMSFLLSVVMILTLALSPVTAYGQTTYTPDFEVRAEAVYMKNLDTGQVIYEKNPDQRMYPASLTKIMTAIVTLENVEDLDGETAYLKLYLQDMIYGTGSSTGGFYLNDEASIRDILYATLLQSAGECALMLADYVGDGSVDHFVDMMNDKAAELGCTGTHFANPHGLFDENNYTTARDMAIISEYAMSIPEFAEIVGTYTHPVQLLNRDATLNELSTNSMLSPSSQYYYAPVYGIKPEPFRKAAAACPPSPSITATPICLSFWACRTPRRTVLPPILPFTASMRQNGCSNGPSMTSASVPPWKKGNSCWRSMSNIPSRLIL